jgi:hypothetical protein
MQQQGKMLPWLWERELAIWARCCISYGQVLILLKMEHHLVSMLHAICVSYSMCSQEPMVFFGIIAYEYL